MLVLLCIITYAVGLYLKSPPAGVYHIPPKVSP